LASTVTAWKSLEKLHYLGRRAFRKIVTQTQGSVAGTRFAHIRLSAVPASAIRDRIFTIHTQ
jgi:hypothetical protein